MSTKYEYRVSAPGVNTGRLVVNNSGELVYTGSFAALTSLTLKNGVAYPVVDPTATVDAQSTNAVLTSTSFGKNVTNTGATGTITWTLPAAADVIGKVLRVQVTAAQITRLVPATGEKIYLGGDGVANKYAQVAGTVGNYADVYSDGTDYLVIGYSGVLTKEA